MARSLATLSLLLGAACSTNPYASGHSTTSSKASAGSHSLGTSGDGSGAGGSSSGAAPTVTTLAGNGAAGWADGTGGPSGVAQFNSPSGVAVDAAGNVFVADTENNRIRRIDPSGNVTTVAGNGDAGFADGPTGTALFNNPYGVALDPAGNVYVADTFNNRIRLIVSDGTVRTFAGRGDAGYADGTGGPTGTAMFNLPYGVTADTGGNLYIAEYNNSRIRKVDAAGNVTTLAGNGAFKFLDGTGGPTGTAEFNEPRGVAVDPFGNVYVADFGNSRIRKIDTTGHVTTLAGNGSLGNVDGTGGPTGTAQFKYPLGVATDANGNVYVADDGNSSIRRIDSQGNVTTYAGTGVQGYSDGPGGLDGTAQFSGPAGIAVDSAGNVYVAEYGNRIRLIQPGQN